MEFSRDMKKTASAFRLNPATSFGKRMTLRLEVLIALTIASSSYTEVDVDPPTIAAAVPIRFASFANFFAEKGVSFSGSNKVK